MIVLNDNKKGSGGLVVIVIDYGSRELGFHPTPTPLVQTLVFEQDTFTPHCTD